MEDKNKIILDLCRGYRELAAELEQAKKERDAAVSDLSECGECRHCKHRRSYDDCPEFERCLECDKWEWRGVQE